MRSQTVVQDSVKVAEIFACALPRFAVCHVPSSIFARLKPVFIAGIECSTRHGFMEFA
jgi:hypothetical protein